MTLKYGAGALATAFAAVAVFFAAGETGARAEAEAPVVIAEIPANESPEAETLPRFVSREVVQPLPEAQPATSAASLHELVAAMPTDAELSGDVRCLAEAIYFEARGEPLHGQLAVGQVIVNRADSGLFPSDYCSVVTQRGQFSFVRGGRIPAVKEGSAAWTRAKAIAQVVHQELWESEAGDALFFHATYVRPSWANRKTARATIDRHVFYR
jgi:spore germination cell wall hydrolase CwlJ-like protein